MPHTPETHPNGTWVPRYDVNPLTNVAGRAFRCADGSEGVYYQTCARRSPITHWYFAPINDKAPQPYEKYKEFFTKRPELISEDHSAGVRCTVYFDQDGKRYRHRVDDKLPQRNIIEYWALAASEGWIPEPTIGR